jgi:hypothetical protein
MGWGHVALIRDLCQILPKPLPDQSQKFVDIWSDNWKKIKTDQASTNAITNEIDAARESVVNIMLELK